MPYIQFLGILYIVRQFLAKHGLKKIWSYRIFFHRQGVNPRYYIECQKRCKLSVDRRMRCMGMKHTWGTRNLNKILVGKPEGKGSVGRPRRRWEEIFNWNLREKGLGRALDSYGSG
jgi:hypothetical protein